MDPNETLSLLRARIAELNAPFDDTEAPHTTLKFQNILIEEVYELFTALDNWLSNNGFPPTDWMVHA